MIASLKSISAATVGEIVAKASRAPSAENTQPWRLEWDGERLLVLHDRSRQMASDVGSMLDFTGLGCLVESLVLVASQYKLTADVDLVPDNVFGQSSPGIARLTFSEGAVSDALAEQLGIRCTTRRMEPRRRVPEGLRCGVAAAADDQRGVRIDWVPDDAIGKVAQLIGLANRIRFEHREFQQELYANMRFSPAEARESRDGLDAATLQLPPGVATLMRLLRPWPRARLANLLGFAATVGRHAAVEVQGSGAVGVLSVSTTTQSSFINGGRAFQRVWLEATRRGLAFHPTAGLPVFMAYAELTEGDRLPLHYQAKAVGMATEFRSLMPSLDGWAPQMLFRLGYGECPETTTLRRDMREFLTLDNAQEIKP